MSMGLTKYHSCVHSNEETCHSVQWCSSLVCFYSVVQQRSSVADQDVATQTMFVNRIKSLLDLLCRFVYNNITVTI